MTAEGLDALRGHFLAYVRDQRSAATAERQPLHELKEQHSCRVAAHARRIAEREGWAERNCTIGEAAGWLHDTGRFDQINRYGTFRDKESVNHGEHGFRVLSELAWFTNCAGGNGLRALLLDAVRYHNRREIPAHVPDGHRPILHLVRDADKLDNFGVHYRAITSGEADRYPELLLHAGPGHPPTPEALEALLRRETVDYGHVHSRTDMVLLHLSWLYDLHYPSSLRHAREEGVVDRVRALLPDDPDIEEAIREAERFLDETLSQ
ncbi:HD domain-containing protein [Kiritimatiella glycovorans]|uniref:Putative HD superfamily hydrolase n=1 Tax=Kiritimatiella glycovorans TaxID=1307763 RepID=A0A0G3EI34_9BACT|nr:HD domain-containing protein [Kiritimatiella glycovorans]AKJ65097.1 putative HD superfamily hydrolase [Kiritimatiella glycovorans]